MEFNAKTVHLQHQIKTMKVRKAEMPAEIDVDVGQAVDIPAEMATAASFGNVYFLMRSGATCTWPKPQ